MPTATVDLLAISGSARALSTHTAMLRAIAARAPAGVRLSVFHRLDQLPVFSPNRVSTPRRRFSTCWIRSLPPMASSLPARNTYGRFPVD